MNDLLWSMQQFEILLPFPPFALHLQLQSQDGIHAPSPLLRACMTSLAALPTLPGRDWSHTWCALCTFPLFTAPPLRPRPPHVIPSSRPSCSPSLPYFNFIALQATKCYTSCSALNRARCTRHFLRPPPLRKRTHGSPRGGGRCAEAMHGSILATITPHHHQSSRTTTNRECNA